MTIFGDRFLARTAILPLLGHTIASMEAECAATAALASTDVVEADLEAASLALATPAVVATVFAALDGAALARCAGVCRLWRDLVCRDVGADRAVWRASYLREYGREPLPHEWAGR